MNKTILSIITINLNNKDGLKNTIESVISQDFKDFEFIVIDGLSTDNSLEIIHKYEKHISFWISEPDNGIYNAMNKGIQNANGEYLLMLNSGDILHSNNVLSQVMEVGLDKDIVYGDKHELVDDKSSYYTEYPNELLFSFFYRYSLGHQTSFIRKRLHDLVGLYIESNQIVSDWCFFTLAICKFDCSYKHIPITVASCKRDGISCDPSKWESIIKERNFFLEQFFPQFYEDYNRMDCHQFELKNNKIYFRSKVNSRITKKIKKWIGRFHNLKKGINNEKSIIY